MNEAKEEGWLCFGQETKEDNFCFQTSGELQEAKPLHYKTTRKEALKTLFKVELARQ